MSDTDTSETSNTSNTSDESDSSDTSKTNNFLIRIVWYDKMMKKYNTGSWHRKETMTEKVQWVQEQNKRYPYTHYWLEGCYVKDDEDIVDLYTKDFQFYPNIESFNVIPIFKYKSNEYEYIFI
jgi:hypothetical protein